MTKAYIERQAGEPIVADDWNQIQIQGREELYKHDHSGDAKGPKLRGDAIDPAAAFSFAKVQAGALSVSGTDVKLALDALQANKFDRTGGVLTGGLAAPSAVVGGLDVKATLDALAAGKLDKAGGTITGALGVVGSLKVAGYDVKPTLDGLLTGKLDKTGGDLTGQLSAPKLLVAGLDVKATLDVLTSGKLDRAGGVMTGSLTFTGGGLVLQNGAASFALPNGGDPLTITGTGNTGLRIVTGDGAGQYAAIRFFGGNAQKAWVSLDSAGGRLYFGTPAGDALHIVDSRVGVNSASPVCALHVNGRGYFEHGIIQRGGAALTTTSDLGLYSQYSGHWIRMVTNNGPFMFFSDNGIGTNTIMDLSAAGVLRVKKLRLWNKWLLSGDGDAEANDAWLRLKNANSPYEYYGGIAAETLWTRNGQVQGSDRARKRDIEAVGQALALVERLRGVSYRWTDAAADAPLQYGVIAQELEEVLPGLVSVGADGLKSVNYSGLVAPLIEAVKALAGRVAALEKDSRPWTPAERVARMGAESGGE